MSHLALRLKSARVMHGLTLDALAERMQFAVTKQALQQYESGTRNPSIDVLSKIAKAVDIKPEYFLRDTYLQLGAFKFRKRSKLGQKWEDALTEKVRNTLERYLELEEIMQAGQVFEHPLKHIVVQTEADAEAAAQTFRAYYQLGNDPLLNALEMLEAIGIKVIVLDEVEEFDGVSTMIDEQIPVIVLNKRLLEKLNESGDPQHDRIRFTALHELAHLVMRIADCDEKQEEKLCHAFAGALLLPESGVNKHFGTMPRHRIFQQELLNVKETYGLSLRAILMRLRRLERITDYDARNWFMRLNKQYGSKSEPGTAPGVERAFRFDQLLYRALGEEVISVSKAAELKNISLTELRNQLTQNA